MLLSALYFPVCSVSYFTPYIYVTSCVTKRCYPLCYGVNKHKCCKAPVLRKHCVYPKKSHSANTYYSTNRRYKSIAISLQTSCHNIHYTLYKFEEHCILHSCHRNFNYQCTDSENSKQLPSCEKCRQAQ